MIQPSEIVTLILSLTAVMGGYLIVRRGPRPRLHAIYLGALFMIAGYVCTVMEGLVWKDAFDAVEHACYALSGVTFAVACVRLTRADASGGDAA